MAVFSNQATLTYNGNSVNSNIAYGEILDVLTVSKTALEAGYTTGSVVTYVVTLRNTGNTQLTGLTVSDNLGGYSFNSATLYPLTYRDDSAILFVNGVKQASPAVTAGPHMVVTGISVPAGGDAVLIYQAQISAYADPSADGAVNNTVTITGDGLSAPVTAAATIPADTAPVLSISKSITPSQVVDNERVTYTFVIQNFGSRPVDAADGAIVTDTFDPTLSALSVTFDGTAWTQGTQYNYTENTGLFSTVAGQILVPAAAYTQNPTTGAYSVTPGVATLVVTGTI